MEDGQQLSTGEEGGAGAEAQRPREHAATSCCTKTAQHPGLAAWVGSSARLPEYMWSLEQRPAIVTRYTEAQAKA